MIKKIVSFFLACSLCTVLVGCINSGGGQTSSEGTSSDETTTEKVELTYYYAQSINDESVVIPVSTPDQSMYYYDNLSDDTVDLKRAYSEIVYAASHLSNPNEDFANVSTVYFPEDLTAKQLNDVYIAVFLDHPEFWFLRQEDKNGCALHPDNSRLAYLTYSEDIADIPYINKDIEAAADKILSGTVNFSADIDKLAYISGYIYDHFRIDWPSYNNSQHSSIKEMLLSGYGVCIGFASTTTYLLHRIGVPAITGHGAVSTGVSHSWTIFERNGVYTYVDNYYMKEKGGGTERSLATYFCMDDISVYANDQIIIHKGVLLPGSPVGAGIVSDGGNSGSSESDTSSQATSSAAVN